MSRRFLGVLFGVSMALGLPFAAQASSVEGCRYEAEVLEVSTDTTGEKPEITLKLKVKTFEEYGHGGGTGLCSAPESEISFEVDNDGDVIKDKLAKGDIIKVSSQTVYNMRKGTGPRRFHSTTYDGRVPPPEAPQTP